MNVVWRKRALLLWALLMLTSQCHCARILCLLPFPSQSHRFVFSSLIQELVDRGHYLTLVSAYSQIPPHPNYTEIIYNVDRNTKDGGVGLFSLKDQGMTGKMVVLWNLGLYTCEKVLQNPDVQRILHSRDLHFDLILVEAFFNECLLGFAHKFHAPTVHICSHGGMFWMGDYVANPYPIAYVPDVLSDFSDHMNFIQRLYNTFSYLFAKIGREFWYLHKQEALMRKYFNDSEDLPSVWELQSNTSAVMLNTHVAVNYPRPLMPNLLLVGGMHIKEPRKLPEDIQKYLDEAQDGVIYFSMGTNLKSALMPEAKRKSFLEAFSKLKQKVLWKWETDLLPGQPSNVKLGKWLPQSDILAHGNVRLFMTHGGMMSTQEALYRGVPMVGIPIFSDQLLNMKQAERAGYALQMDFDNITAESVYWAIQQVLTNPSYKDNADRVSCILRDNPLPPLKMAAYWVEYVIRHKETPHLHSAALDLTWYQYFLLDVIAFLLVAMASIMYVIYLVVRNIFRKSGTTKLKKS